MNKPLYALFKALFHKRQQAGRCIPVALTPPPGSEKADNLFHYTRASAEISPHEKDALLVKMIGELRKMGVPVHSILSRVRNTPITATNETPSIVSLSQYFTPLPGLSLELKARFRRGGQRSVPISFEIIDKPCPKPLFPHASQYTGWILADVCITAMPQRPDLLPLWSALYKKRTAIITSMTYVQQLEQVEQRKMQFNSQCAIHIDAHHALMRAIAASAGITCEHAPIDRFFDRLHSLNEPFDYLAATSQAIAETFIRKPYHQTAVSRNPEELQSYAEMIDEDLRERIAGSASVLERTTLEYILCIGQILRIGIDPLIRQEMSGTQLGPFSRKLQAAAFKQAHAFVTAADLSEELEKDISLFTEGPLPFQDHLDELENYYTATTLKL